MTKEIKIKRGLDIPLEGKSEGKVRPMESDIVGVCPDDFPGYAWKCDVKPGDKVAQGSPSSMPRSMKTSSWCHRSPEQSKRFGAESAERFFR